MLADGDIVMCAAYDKRLKKFHKDLDLVGEMQYGGHLYVTGEVFGLDPEQMKKELESEID